jgi:hypothetical protein
MKELLITMMLLSSPAIAEQPRMEKCWSDTLYRQYDCPAVGWPYGTITQEQVAGMGATGARSRSGLNFAGAGND